MPARTLPEKFHVAFSFAGEQRDLVRSIAEELERQLGATGVFLDEWFEHYLAGDNADLKLQKIYGEQCDLVVVCVSERYGGKPWTLAEHAAVRARQMKCTNEKEKLGVLPIRVGDGDVEGILFNTIVPDVRGRTTRQAAELIIERLRLIVSGLIIVSEPLPSGDSWPETPPPLRWPVANHRSVRDAFAILVTRNAPWRFLPVRGPSGTGKSHITRQILANSLRLSWLACGRFDFKGTTDMDVEVGSFVQDLGVNAPPPGLRLNERFGHILQALKRRAQPALLIFDTYEKAAGEDRDWVEKQLLQNLIRDTWLRVVIAGQEVPQSAGAVWEADASPVISLTPPPPADWLEYGRQHRPGLTLAQVEAVCLLAAERGSLLAQLLGPAT
jgi:hypothetical protein